MILKLILGSQNLLRFYHGFPPMGGTVQKLMHVAFGFGCFLALLCVIVLTNISGFNHPQPPKNEVSLNISKDQDTHQLPAKSIFRRSLIEDNLNSSTDAVNESKFVNMTTLALNSSVSSKNPAILDKSPNLTSKGVSTSMLGDVHIGDGNITETSPNNDTEILLDSSSSIPPLMNVTTHSVAVINATIQNVTEVRNFATTPFPTKPAVLDSNNQNHHKEGADGKIIKQALKNELEKNPLEAKPAGIPGTNNAPLLYNRTTPSITTVSSGYSTSNETMASLKHNVTSEPDNLVTSDLNNEEGPTTAVNEILSGSNSTEIDDQKVTGAEETLGSSSIRTTDSLLNVPASAITTTVSAKTTTVVVSNNLPTTTSTVLSSTAQNYKTSSNSPGPTNSIATTTVHRNLIDQTGLPSDSRSFKSSSTTTVAMKASLLSTATKPLTSPTKSNTETLMTKDAKVLDGQVVITQLEKLEAFLKSMSWDSSSSAGFYLLSLIVFLISGMLAINSGICGKSKNCRSHPEVNYTCSEKDSLSFRGSVCVRLSTVTFHWAYDSVEILAGGLLASYFVSISGVPLYVGVAATGLFWFSFFCGRLAFVPLSSLAKMFRLTFLAAFLTIACLVAFLCMLHSMNSLPWYFFACMISLAAFFFSLVSPSFQGYRENFPLLSYNLPLQDVLCSLGEVAIPPLVCSLIFARGSCHLVSSLIALMVACLASVLCFKFFVNSIPKKLKSSRRKPSFASDNWGENGEEAEVLTSSFDNGSTTKPLLLP